MTISSTGFAGTVDYAEWAALAAHSGTQYGVVGKDAYAAAVGSGDRKVAVQPGLAAGQGILDVSDAVETLTGAPVAAGDRWDLLVLRRDWSLNTSTLVLVTGGPTASIPVREMTPGVKDDQPLWLVRFTAGQSAAQEFIDLRVWNGDGGLAARHLLVRSYLDRLGSRIWINGITWVLGFNATGDPTWVPDSVYVGTTAPPFAENLVWVKKP
ncbi:hypothetical protein DC31_13950 [Microbacterium sp. CH12i]|uniref:hypothetical protein n=1 Tax=Microbacterium sp. CH12i TaxID=1479651 RepID=UPI0004619AFA|nr:hypothetical protein [Microbacterium sp. CH12i]KDA05865.1 hypothetical protein DC31_13950 [Microbacterium sp. CH12i]